LFSVISPPHQRQNSKLKTQNSKLEICLHFI
jgi:hypothetical protein